MEKMQIDATLLVQGCNFFLFYWMLRLLLFRPVVAYLQGKEQEKQRLLDTVAGYQRELAVLNQQQQSSQRDARSYFLQNRPMIPELIIETACDLTTAPLATYTTHEVDALVKDGSTHVLNALIRD